MLHNEKIYEYSHLSTPGLLHWNFSRVTTHCEAKKMLTFFGYLIQKLIKFDDF